MTESTLAFIDRVGRGSSNATVREIRTTNKERTPMFVNGQTTGILFDVKDVFSDLLSPVMDYDNVSDMSMRGLKMWNEFSIYESNATGFNPELDNKYYSLDQYLMAWYNI